MHNNIYQIQEVTHTHNNKQTKQKCFIASIAEQKPEIAANLFINTFARVAGKSINMGNVCNAQQNYIVENVIKIHLAMAMPEKMVGTLWKWSQ